ncbi:MAG: EutP/PduV family microcompartment system protein [Synergistaceae bacterium]|jgi:ethanolamine utilization protein EutP|nr:EutP/PduV family microcompartment system protein [Synergistaceae bacterium]
MREGGELSASYLSANRKLMVAGPTRAGKSTLLRALGYLDDVRKTQMVVHGSCFIDTPGELLNHLYLYRSLLQNANKAGLVLFLADPTQMPRYPPKFSTAIRGRVLGVVTKIDLATESMKARSKKALEVAGAKEVMFCSSLTGEGIPELREKIDYILGGAFGNER